MNYKDSGVDIEAGNAFAKRLKEKAPSIGGLVECLEYHQDMRNLY